MTKDKLKPFEELTHSDQIVRLDAFGGVQTNLYEHDNPLIECFFTPQKEHYSNNVKKFTPLVNQQFRAGIAVGYLPTLTIGQLFQKGEWLPLDDWPKIEKITIDLDVSKPNIVQELRLANLELEYPFLGDKFKKNGNQNGFKLLDGTLIKSTDQTKEFLYGTQQYVAINELEIIRYYLTNSSHSCKNIFNGAFTNKNLYVDVINNNETNIDYRTGAARLVYRMGYKKDDAPILARILFEKNGLALQAAQRVHSTIVSDRLNSEANLYGYPRTYFPFTGTTRLELSGRRLKTKTGFIFLAYRIISCSAKFPFTSLSFCSEIEPGDIPAPESAPPAFPNANNVATGAAHLPGGLGTSKSNQPPQSNSSEIEIELNKRVYPGLNGIPIKREKLKDSTYSFQKKFREEVEGMTDASTGVGTSAISSAARQSLSSPMDTEHLSADLSTFIEVINCLRTQYPDWSIETFEIEKGKISEGERCSFFPPVPCKKRKKIMRQFSYMDDAKKELKSFISVQIKIEEKYVYLFESQRRFHAQQLDSQSIYIDRLPILLVWGNGFVEKTPNAFLDMIRATVKNTTWPLKIEGFNRDYTIHGAGVKTSEEMSIRIAQLIFRNLS